MDSIAGKEGSQVLFDSDGSDPRSSATVGYAEGFVEVQVRDVPSELPGSCHADERVEICAVDVDLSAYGMDFFTNCRDPFLEDSVGGRVGDHDRGDFGSILLDLLIQVHQVDISLGVACDDDDLHVGHLSAGWIGTVGRAWDQADVSVPLALRFVVLHDGQQSCVLALGAGVGLQGDLVVSGRFAQHRFELIDQDPITFGLIGWSQRMDGIEFGPGHPGQFGGGVEFHGA